MLEPIILTDEIVEQARLWRDECIDYLGTPSNLLKDRVGEASLTSPVDGQERKVVLYLATQIGRLKGWAAPPSFKDNSGNLLAPEGCYSILINRERQSDPETLLAVILHEITHTIDPCFDEDCRYKAGLTLDQRNRMDQYILASEQRAFTAMWIEMIRERLANRTFYSVGAFIELLNLQCEEFSWFFGYARFGRPHLRVQIESHFKAIVEHLRLRLGL